MNGGPRYPGERQCRWGGGQGAPPGVGRCQAAPLGARKPMKPGRESGCGCELETCLELPDALIGALGFSKLLGGQ